MLDWIFAAIIGGWVIKTWWKHQVDPAPYSRRNTVKDRWDAKKRKARKLEKKRKGARKITDEELIAVVIPTIDGK